MILTQFPLLFIPAISGGEFSFYCNQLATVHFRFKKCLEAGMKPSWVLSDEERNRRFNKFNKLNVKSVNPEDRKSRPAAASQLRLPELYMTFTMEEHKLIDDIQKKFTFCHKAWLRNLLIFGRFICFSHGVMELWRRRRRRRSNFYEPFAFLV